MLSPRSPCCRPRPASPAQTFVIGNALLGRVVCDHAYLRFKHSRSRRLGLCPVHVDIMECHLEAGMLSVGCSDETIKVRKGRADGDYKGALYPSRRAGWFVRGGLGGRTGVGCSWQRSWLRSTPPPEQPWRCCKGLRARLAAWHYVLSNLAPPCVLLRASQAACAVLRQYKTAFERPAPQC